MPAHAAASVTRQIRPGAAANAIAQAAADTWLRSTMSPLVSRWSVSAWPTTPGSRWCSPRCALNRWVTIRAPAAAPAATSRGGGVAVAHADQHPRRGQRPDRGQRAVGLGRQRHQPQQPLPGLQQFGDRARGRRHDPVPPVRARAGRGQEGPLQVHAEDTRSRGHRFRCFCSRTQRRGQRWYRSGDERREERRRAGFRQPPCHQGPAIGVTVGEIDAVVAVDLQIHQARHEHAGAQIQVGCPRRRTLAHLGDDAALDAEVAGRQAHRCPAGRG